MCLFAGCKNAIKWKRMGVDFESFLCTKEYAIDHGVIPVSSHESADFYLVCRLCNHSGMLIYVKMQYSGDGIKQDIEISLLSDNKAKWETKYIPIDHFKPIKVGSNGRKDVILKTKKIVIK